MSDSQWDDAVGEMLIDFDDLVPVPIPEDKDSLLVKHFDRLRTYLETMTAVQRRAVVDLMAEAFEMGDKCARDPAMRRPSAAEVEDMQRVIRGAVADLIAGTPADGPLPANSFHVGAIGDEVCWLRQPAMRLTKQRALELAVWLIALADPTLSDAVPMLLRVATR